MADWNRIWRALFPEQIPGSWNWRTQFPQEIRVKVADALYVATMEKYHRIHPNVGRRLSRFIESYVMCRTSNTLQYHAAILQLLTALEPPSALDELMEVAEDMEEAEEQRENSVERPLTPPLPHHPRVNYDDESDEDIDN